MEKHLTLFAAVRTTLFVAGVLFASVTYAAEAEVDVSPKPTQRYLVTTTHTPEQCLAALDEMAAKKQKTLSKMQWGCKGGDHTGYLITDSADKDAALALLPESSRAGAKVIELTKFTPKQLKAIHAKMDKEQKPAAK